MKYTQCRLENGSRYRVAWVPPQFAVVDKVLTICNEEGWIVKAVYSTKSDYEIHTGWDNKYPEPETVQMPTWG